MNEQAIVLLVDDDDVCHQIVKKSVEALGFTFKGLFEGAQFMQTVNVCLPALILLDINLPDISGFKLCRDLQSNPLNNSVPVLFLTGMDTPENIDEGFRCGAVDYITKPFRSEELRARIQVHAKLVMTQRKLEQEVQIKQKLFSLISHDLRSPFSSMIGVMQLLLSEYSSMEEADRKEFLQALLDNSLQQLTLLDNLMYWSRGQSDRITITLNPLPLAVMVKSVFDSLQSIAQEKEIELVSEIKSDLQVLADTDLTRVILKNLVHNGIKYCESRGRVQVYVPIEITSAGLVSIFIEDNGKGTSEQILASNRFVSTPGTAGEKGAGIGLKISDALAKRQGGYLRLVKSDPSGTVMGLGLQRSP